jgi:phosphatidylglycerol:prolipoprotein diacylglycerol transferase
MTMQPVLWQIGPLKIHAYGLFLAIAFLFAGWLTGHRGRPHNLAEREMTNYVTLILIVSLIGARLYYVLGHPDRFAGRWGELIEIWKGGLVLHGGILAGVIVSFLYARRVGWRIGVLADVVAPGLAFGEAIGRIGCFLNGCCYGSPTSSVCGISFPEGTAAHDAFGGSPIHPTQLYLFVLQGCVGLLLLLIGRRASRTGRWRVGAGSLFGLYLSGSSAVRFVVDFFRVYPAAERPWLGLAHSQLVAAILGLVGVWLMVRVRGRAR